MNKKAAVLGAYGLPALVVLFGNQPFEGYLDAGSGSIILQAVLGVLIGALFAIKIFWHRIKAFFGALFSRGQTRDGSEPEDN